LAVLLGFVSGLFWLWIFVRQDKYEPEPKRWITLIFFLGMLSIIPAIILETIFELFFGPLSTADVVGSFIAQFFGIGPIEEFCKFLVVLFIYWNREFDEPMDGIVYSTSAALGFATVENILYMTQTGTTGGVISLFFLRFFLSTLAHIFFSAMWGYKLGMRKMKIHKSIIFGLLLAAFLHGLYNFILTHIIYLGILIIPLMIVMWLMMRSRVKHALRISPHRTGETKLVKCPFCGALAVFSGGICVACGKKYTITSEIVLACPRCKTKVSLIDVICPDKKCRLKLLPISTDNEPLGSEEKPEPLKDDVNASTEGKDEEKDPSNWKKG